MVIRSLELEERLASAAGTLHFQWLFWRLMQIPSYEARSRPQKFHRCKKKILKLQMVDGTAPRHWYLCKLGLAPTHALSKLRVGPPHFLPFRSQLRNIVLPMHSFSDDDLSTNVFCRLRRCVNSTLCVLHSSSTICLDVPKPQTGAIFGTSCVTSSPLEQT